MITVENLQFTYQGTAVPAIHSLSFHINPGEIFGFLGPSGAGKSTTQKILTGLLKSYQGHVTVLGKDLSTWQSDYYERIGVSFELPNHFLKLTAHENLTYFGALYSRTTRKPADLLQMVGLGTDGDLLVSQYSKGMKNRLTFARALLHDPELLFLDEPTAGLDPMNAHRIKNLIQEQKAAGKTIFLTTHDMAVANELCDRVAFIVDGRIVLINTPRQLKLEHGRATVQVEYHVNGHMEQQEFPLPNLGNNDSFLNLLKTQTVETMHTQEATLENIFIQVTGRTLTV